MPQASLEISLHRRDADSYGIEMRFSDPDSETDRRFSSPAVIRFDPDRLRSFDLDPAAYGHYLTEQIFAEPEVRSFFDQALATSQAQDMPLNVRLFIGPSAPELHSLRWETMILPDASSPLLTGENLRFSRYLSSMDWRPVRLRPQAKLRALVVVASPNDVSKFQMADVIVENELESARAGLGDIKITELAAQGEASGVATLGNIAKHLRDGYDILYLVAHGLLVDGKPWLFLEKEDGTTDRVPGRELVTRIHELQDRPRLVVLISCQGAGTGKHPTTQDHGALSGLGPQLAEAGVPAVIAMQGNVTMQTIADFTPVFFEEIQRDGQVDRAIAVARGSIRDRPDWWMPVLFMRLRSGRIWYNPGFGDDREGLKKWPALKRNITRGRCTPILGSGLNEETMGSRREIARRWAETYGFPMAPHSRESLPQVAQYLATDQDVPFVRDELEDHLRRELWSQFGQTLSPDMEHAPLNDLINQVGKQQAKDKLTPFQTLAKLPIPIYVNTNPGDLLPEALRAEGKEPVIELCRWNEELIDLPSIFDDRESYYRPTPERPLVYYLFGRISEPDSLVLTEDDYFDFLIGVTANKDLIPEVVRRALTDTALLFLGFNMDEWDFRVLFRSIMNREGRGRRSRYAHIAAQINPEEGRILEPEGARHYLESYFQDADISIFWGSVDDFSDQLDERLSK